MILLIIGLSLSFIAIGVLFYLGYQKNKQIENNMEMISLYDYLGRAAGPDLGKQVATAAAKAGVKGETRQVSNPVYKGPVMLYPKAFLDLYFKGGLNEGTNGKQMLYG